MTDKYDLSDRITVRAFLSMLRNMRYVILQYVAVMISIHKRIDVLFEQFPVFKLHKFKDFQINLIHRMKGKDSNEEIFAIIEKVLPGVRQRLGRKIDHQYRHNDALKLIHEENREYQRDMSREHITRTIENSGNSFVNNNPK